MTVINDSQLLCASLLTLPSFFFSFSALTGRIKVGESGQRNDWCHMFSLGKKVEKPWHKSTYWVIHRHINKSSYRVCARTTGGMSLSCVKSVWGSTNQARSHITPDAMSHSIRSHQEEKERREDRRGRNNISTTRLAGCKQKLHFQKLPIGPIKFMRSSVLVLLSPSGENQVFYTLLMCSYDGFLYSKRNTHHGWGLLIWICSAGLTKTKSDSLEIQPNNPKGSTLTRSRAVLWSVVLRGVGGTQGN